MANKLILHIPHSSDYIPNFEGYLVKKEVINKEIQKLTDWYTDELFSSPNDITIKAQFSRVFCDPERFEDDDKEVMSQYGMGVLYENSDNGQLIREVNHTLRETVLDTYYRPHHKRFTVEVENQLKLLGKATIVDCHSFPNLPFKRDLSQRLDRPDFSIGTDSFHTPLPLIEASKDFFKNKGFTLGVDWPYSGTIVPMDYFQKTKKVKSIMLEVNRSLYLNEPNNEKSSDFYKIKDIVQEYLELLRTATI